MGKLKKWYKRKMEEMNKKPEYFESRLVEFLELLFVKTDLTEKDLKKKLYMSHKEFYSIKEFAKNKHYIIGVVGKDFSYRISQEGTDYLLESKKIEAEKRTSFWMMMATFSIALIAIITLITNSSAALYFQDYTCPSRISQSNNYSAYWPITTSNLGGGRATSTSVSYIGENVNKIFDSGTLVISSGSSGRINSQFHVINSSEEELSFYLKVKYYSLIFPKSIDTPLCNYEKTEHGHYELVKN